MEAKMIDVRILIAGAACLALIQGARAQSAQAAHGQIIVSPAVGEPDRAAA